MATAIAQRAIEAVGIGLASSFMQAKQRREHIRWLSLLLINEARPAAPTDSNMLACIQSEYHDATIAELRKELDYLRLRGLLTLTESFPRWHLHLTYQGVDIVEYNSSDVVGIARPPVAVCRDCRRNFSTCQLLNASAC